METNSLENCIRTLKEVLDANSCQLDTSTVQKLIQVIDDLNKVNDGRINQKDSAEVRLRGLQTVAAILRIATDIRDWME